MNDYAAAINSVVYPPNPNQQLNRAYRTTPANNNEQAGLTQFTTNIASFPIPGGASCSTCHTLPRGTNGFTITASILQEPQQMKVPQIRNMYRKLGFNNAPGQQKSGFGYTHDGALDTLPSFFAQPVFNPWPSATKDDLVTFLLSDDTGTAPAVGYQFVLNQANAASPQFGADMTLVTTRAAAGDLDLVAHGLVDGRLVGLLWQTGTANFTSDRTGEGPFTQAQLVSKALAGNAALVLTAVPPGSGNRLGLDRDLDLTKNGDEDADPYGTGTAGCAGVSTLLANSEPRVGNAQFGYVLGNAQANTFVLIALALGQASIPVLGVTVLVDPLSAVPIGLAADGFGGAIHPFPIPPNPGFVGLPIYAQALWLDSCGAEWWAASAGLGYSVRP